MWSVKILLASFAVGTLAVFVPPAFRPWSHLCTECRLKYLDTFFHFDLCSILSDWLMTPFCLQKVKKVYKICYSFRGKSTQRSFLQLKCLSNTVSIHETMFITSFSSDEKFSSTVSFQRSDTPIFPYIILVICKQMTSSADT